LVEARLQVSQPVCIELFSDFPQLGRFTLRDKGKTIAVGKVIKLQVSKNTTATTTTTTTASE